MRPLGMQFGITTLIVVAAGVRGVSAQFHTSPQCLPNITTALNAGAPGAPGIPPATTCLHVPGLVNIMITPPAQSIVPAIQSWLDTMCTMPVCSNDTLRTVVMAIPDPCKTVSGSPTAIDQVLAVYPAYRRAYCLPSNTTSRWCAVEMLMAIEAMGKIITASNVDELTSGSVALPQGVVCSECNKATLNIFRQQNPPWVLNTTVEALGRTCSFSSVGDQTPPSVQQG